MARMTCGSSIQRRNSARSDREVQTNRDPNRDKALARSNQPITLETYRRQDDVFDYELEFKLSGVLTTFQNLN